jgi:cobaltochelatase CobS
MENMIIGWSEPAIEVEAKPVNALFGISSPSNVLCHKVVTNINYQFNEDYYFDGKMLKKLFNWIYGVSSRRNILLFGDAGVGKTSIIIEVAARLGIPVFQMACSGKTRFQHFVGSRELVNGETRWVDGALVKAMRSGGIFLMDEVTRLDPGEQMNLAAVLDGYAKLTIPDTGEVVTPHPNFRIAATGNSGGYGDESGAYIGEKPSSFAFLDRFQKFKIVPMPKEAEKALLIKMYNMPNEIVDSMLNLASAVRSNFVGAGGGFNVTISPRSMHSWAQEIVNYSNLGFQNPVWEALEDTVLNGAPSIDVQTIKELYDKWF